MKELISPEDALDLVLSKVSVLDVEEVPLLDAAGRVAAADLCSDIDISPFDHAAMDGFCLRAEEIEGASEDAPVVLEVVAEIPAGSHYEGDILPGQCCRIMTGAPLPAAADSVVKYEIVGVCEGDGKIGSKVSFAAPTKLASNVRKAGEEARAGQVIVQAGEALNTAGIGFLASCGIVKVPVYRRPTIAIIATGSELVDPGTVPGPGQIRNSNSYAMAACAKAAGALPVVLPIAPDSLEGLTQTVLEATKTYDFVMTTGGAANGDYDYIKTVVSTQGELFMSTVNMRPGKAQTFGVVNGTPVFGLPGNPAAAYCGFELLVRPALRKMQGFPKQIRPVIKARLSKDVRKKDPRRIYQRATVRRAEDGGLVVVPDANQSSGSFGVIQRSTCLAVMPEGMESKSKGDLVDCVLLDVPEGIVLP